MGCFNFPSKVTESSPEPFVTWIDDFIGDTIDARYDLTTPASSTIAVVDNVPGGAARVDTAAGEDNQAIMRLGSASFEVFTPLMAPVMTFRTKQSNVNNAAIIMGWYQGSSHQAVFQIDGTDGSISTYGKGGTAGDSSAVDTTVNVTAATWRWFRIACQPDLSVVFQTSTDANPANWTTLRTSDAGLLYDGAITGTLFISVNDGSAAQTQFDIDYLSIKATRT